MTWGPHTIREADGGSGLLYPVPARSGRNAIEFDRLDGARILQAPARAYSVQVHREGKFREMESVSEIHLTLYVTDARIAFCCSNYDKGGGWIGGLSSLLLNAGSKALATWRSNGLSLVGQVRYAWLFDVGGFQPSGHTGSESLRIVMSRRVEGNPYKVVLDFALPKDVSSVKVAAEIARRAAAYRLAAGEALTDPDGASVLAALTRAEPIIIGGKYGMHSLPSAWPMSEKSADLRAHLGVAGTDSTAGVGQQYDPQGQHSEAQDAPPESAASAARDEGVATGSLEAALASLDGDFHNDDYLPSGWRSEFGEWVRTQSEAPNIRFLIPIVFLIGRDHSSIPAHYRPDSGAPGMCLVHDGGLLLLVDTGSAGFIRLAVPLTQVTDAAQITMQLGSRLARRDQVGVAIQSTDDQGEAAVDFLVTAQDSQGTVGVDEFRARLFAAISAGISAPEQARPEPEAAFCTECGTAFDEVDAFCRECGVRRGVPQATGPAASSSATVPEDTLPRSTLPRISPAATATSAASAGAQDSRRSVGPWLVASLVAAVILVSGVGYLLTRDDGDVITGVGVNAPATGTYADGSDNAGGSEAVRPTGFDSAQPESWAIWTGGSHSGTPPEYLVVLRLQTVSAGRVDGQVYVRNLQSGQSGSWELAGTASEQTIRLEPGAWIEQPSATWERDAFEFDRAANGDLFGTAESASGARWNVELTELATSTTEPEITAEVISGQSQIAFVLPESTAAEILAEMRQADSSRRDQLNGSWVPQVSSACRGLATSSGVLTSNSILARHLENRADFDAITVTWDDIGTRAPESCPSETMWVALVPQEFSSSAGALQWCVQQGIGRDDCAARYVVPRGTPGTEMVLRD